MSVVTNVLICLNLLEEIDDQATTPPISEINDYLSSRGYGGLARVDDLAGGNKAFQAGVWLGAFNHLNIKEFMDVVKSRDWLCRDDVQVLLKKEEDYTFTLTNI
jgi:hypothetical protein